MCEEVLFMFVESIDHFIVFKSLIFACILYFTVLKFFSNSMFSPDYF